MNTTTEMDANPSLRAHPTPIRLATAATALSEKRPPAPRQHTAHALLSGALLAASGLALITNEAQAVGETARVSVNSLAETANAPSRNPTLSGDGRFVAFWSDANNLVPGDTNGAADVFVHDRRTGQTTRVSVDSFGNQATPPPGSCGDCNSPSLSYNGRFVAFQYSAGDLVPNDTNDTDDVFVHDRETGQTTRVSVDSLGNQTGGAGRPVLSADGRVVAFGSTEGGLVPDDGKPWQHVYVHNRNTHRTTRVSVDAAGKPGNGNSAFTVFSLSADGRFVAFESGSDNLVPGDTNGKADVFVHDQQTRQTTRVSVDSMGNQGNAHSTVARLSADGRFVAFESGSNNLVPGDTNEQADVYVHDRQTGQTTLVSVDLTGNLLSHGGSLQLWAISADGRFVAFETSDLQSIYPAGVGWVALIHDRAKHKTTLLGTDSAGNPMLSYHGFSLDLSADGRFAAFGSAHESYVNVMQEIFVRDRLLDRSASADLRISQTVDPDSFQSLSPLTYTLTAVNRGPDAAAEVTLVDKPPLVNATVVAVTPSQGTCSQGAPLVCYLGTLPAGASSTVTLTVKPRWQSTISLWNTAQINAAPVDPWPANNKSTVRTDVAP